MHKSRYTTRFEVPVEVFRTLGNTFIHTLLPYIRVVRMTIKSINWREVLERKVGEIVLMKGKYRRAQRIGRRGV